MKFVYIFASNAYCVLVSPCWIFGPFAPGFEHIIPVPDFKSFSTNSYIHALLRPDNAYYPLGPGIVDVRDVAKAHVLALDSAPSSDVGHKRYLVVSPHEASYSAFIKVIAENRPELRGRLADAGTAPSFTFPTDLERKGLEDVIGFKTGQYTSWTDTVLDTVDSIIALENLWKEKGYEIVQPEGSPF